MFREAHLAVFLPQPGQQRFIAGGQLVLRHARQLMGDSDGYRQLHRAGIVPTELGGP